MGHALFCSRTPGGGVETTGVCGGVGSAREGVKLHPQSFFSFGSQCVGGGGKVNYCNIFVIPAAIHLFYPRHRCRYHTSYSMIR